jgi:hypothetical protein
MELSKVIAENDQLKELLREMHDRISYLENKLLNEELYDDKPHPYEANDIFKVQSNYVYDSYHIREKNY